MSMFAIVVRSWQFIRGMTVCVLLVVTGLTDLLNGGSHGVAWDIGFLLAGLVFGTLGVLVAVKRTRREIARRRLENKPVAEAPDAGTFWRREGYVRNPRPGDGAAN
jgi:hypothetical protein